ncbi:AraC family transcriptional regulator [Oscillospiraceae bacterium LTW-04]|nr:AraC family transcriptional regulator [Oscillospiraceae bacterium MB24-C1]
MDWIKRLNAAINYIEEHLTDELNYEQLGRIACCSAYHFQRMFGYMAGVSLSEYIRRRRKSRAAADLQSGDQKIIDIAAKYGYDSPTAFNRAFQSVHGFAPSQAREKGRVLTSFPPISFQITIKGAVQMDYRIEKKEAFRIVGLGMEMDKDMEKNFETVPKMWAKAAQDGSIAKMCGLMNGQPKGVLGISACNGAAEQWRYYIAVASTLPADGFEEYLVPAATWAIFTGQGTGTSIQVLEQRIITEWLPTSGYEYSTGPDVEVYFDPTPENTRYEVWVPVIKQNG